MKAQPANQKNGKSRRKGSVQAKAVVTVPNRGGQASRADSGLAGRRVLIVDDDVRNIFALTSMLESQGIDVQFEERGDEAIRTLTDRPNFDIVLMDVMMPEMDGYETIRRIREIDGLKSIPIIALTAKAMEGDREKCLAAGASDYIPKPVDTEALFEMMRMWVGVPTA